jgi:hypothetical protein
MVGEELAGMSEQLGKLGPGGKEAAVGVTTLTNSFEALFRLFGWSYAGGHITNFLNQLGIMNKESARLGPLIFENAQQLHLFTTRLGLAVGGMAVMLHEMDMLEKKQAELNRALGIGVVSITKYYEQLSTASGMGGKAARASAEEIMKALTEQRMWSEQEINQMLPLFVKYSLGISKSFPKDFVTMHEQLGMSIDNIADSYETMALNAAAAGVPLELYKNTVFGLTSQIQQYGFSIRDAMAFTNLFTDDLKKGTITAREAQQTMQALAQSQMTGGGFGFRVKMAMMLGRAWGDVPSNIKESLETETRQRYGDTAKYRNIGIAYQADVLQNVAPEIYGQVFAVAGRETLKMFPKAIQAVAFAQFWPGFEAMAFQQRIGPALEKGGPVFAESIKDLKDPTVELTNAIKELEKTMETSTKGMREWYYPFLQFMDYLRSQGLGGVAGAAGGIGGAVLGAAPGAIMTALALRGVGFGGGIAGGAGGAGVAGLTLGMARFVPQIAVVTGAFVDLVLVTKTVIEGFKFLKAKSEEKETALTQEKTLSGTAKVLYGMMKAQALSEAGKGELAIKALKEYGPWVDDPRQLYVELAHIKDLTKTQYEKYKATAGPGAAQGIAKMVQTELGMEVQKTQNEITIILKPQKLIIPLGEPPKIGDLTHPK